MQIVLARRKDVSKLYNDEELAKRVFVIILCGVLIEVVAMVVVAL